MNIEKYMDRPATLAAFLLEHTELQYQSKEKMYVALLFIIYFYNNFECDWVTGIVIDREKTLAVRLYVNACVRLCVYVRP